MRGYRVLLRQTPAPDAQEGGPPTLADLGEHEAHDAEAAIGIACDAANLALPDKASARCVAVPTNNWSEREVEEDPRPRFRVRPVQRAAQPGDAQGPEDE